MPPVKLIVAELVLHVGWVIMAVKVAGAGFTVTTRSALSLSIPLIVWLT